MKKRTPKRPDTLAEEFPDDAERYRRQKERHAEIRAELEAKAVLQEVNVRLRGEP